MTSAQAASGGFRLGSLLLIILAALLWGVYWVPIRFLEASGLPGIWAGLVLMTAAFVPAVTLNFIRRAKRPDAVQIIAAILVGIAIALYGAALAYTDVVRAILLFYLTPIWSILIECAFFGRKWHHRSGLAVLAALLGIVLIFRGELPLDGLGAIGDWMSLVAGVAWSVATALLYSRGTFQPISLSAWSIGAATAISGVVAMAIGADVPPLANVAILEIGHTLTAALLIGSAFVLPIILLTLWGASQFSAVIMGFILTAEIVSGVASSAIFLGERFGWPEVAGTALIMVGASIEIISIDKVSSSALLKA